MRLVQGCFVILSLVLGELVQAVFVIALVVQVGILHFLYALEAANNTDIARLI
jgi:hypothetical protein